MVNYSIINMIGGNIVYFDRVTSTNDIAIEHVKSGKAVHGTVISAGKQSNGRGQRGNKWESSYGKNLIISIILYPENIEASRQFLISKAVSVALVRLLSEYSPEISIKWPNDIYAGDDKIAGILIENSVKGDRLESSVVGIGLNLNQTAFSAGLPNPISLSMITGRNYNTKKILAHLCTHVESLYLMVENSQFMAVDNAYYHHLYRRSVFSDFRVKGLPIKGSIEGVDEFGRLLLKDERGIIRNFSFREIEFIP